ncbi:Sir2 family NAD-dependent protein deacetylase [Undibacterium arcticum]
MNELLGFLQRYPNVLVLTGAGMSTASGIPDYRDRDGVRRGKAPVQGPDFRGYDSVRKRYWARSMVGWPTLARAEPNAGHRAIAELEANGNLAAVVTQNVDGLHQRAGSVRIVELHGNIHSVVCVECGMHFSRGFMQSLLQEANPGLAGAMAVPAPDGDAHLEPDCLTDFRIPDCLHCAGVLKPDVVFFGDGVPRARTEAAEKNAGACRCLACGGIVTDGVLGLSAVQDRRGDRQADCCNQSRKKTRADHLLSLKNRETCRTSLAIAGPLSPSDLTRQSLAATNGHSEYSVLLHAGRNILTSRQGSTDRFGSNWLQLYQ